MRRAPAGSGRAVRGGVPQAGAISTPPMRCTGPNAFIWAGVGNEAPGAETKRSTRWRAASASSPSTDGIPRSPKKFMRYAVGSRLNETTDGAPKMIGLRYPPAMRKRKPVSACVRFASIPYTASVSFGPRHDL